MKNKKYYTVKEWKKFKKNNYFDMQELLCEKYDVILTDYKTKRQRIISILSHINLKNLDHGITQFNKLFQSFGDSAEQLSKELNHSKQNKQNLDSIWGESTNSVANLEKIWGKKK